MQNLRLYTGLVTILACKKLADVTPEIILKGWYNAYDSTHQVKIKTAQSSFNKQKTRRQR